MKYSMYAKKNEPKYKRNNKYNSLLWEMNEQGYKVCPNGYVFSQYVNEKYNEDGKYLRIIQLYENKEMWRVSIQRKMFERKKRI